MLEVVGHRVLVKPDALAEQVQVPESLADKGFAVHYGEDAKRQEAATQIGVVVSVGPTAFRAFDGSDPNWKPWCKRGDKIIFAKYAGKWVEDPDTKEKFFVINDEDVQVVVHSRLSAFEELISNG